MCHWRLGELAAHRAQAKSCPTGLNHGSGRVSVAFVFRKRGVMFGSLDHVPHRGHNRCCFRHVVGNDPLVVVEVGGVGHGVVFDQVLRIPIPGRLALPKSYPPRFLRSLTENLPCLTVPLCCRMRDRAAVLKF